MNLGFVVEVLIKIVVIMFIQLTGFAYMTLFERRVIARMQARLGPNRVGPFGFLQPLADGIKLIFKEDIIPARADRILYLLAPIIVLVPSMIAFAVVPIGPPISLFERTYNLYLADVNIAILYFLGMGSLAVYGVVLAGWASNNKYSLLGGMRASAQMVSYELALGLSMIGVLMLSGSMSLVSIVNAQVGAQWYILPQLVGFVLFVISMLAETRRSPFDLPEAEQELVGGFHTEYSGMKFALFYMGEYIAMITIAAVAVSLFLGGWRGPFAEQVPLLGVLYFFIKLGAFMFFFVWVRATLPRLRYDRLMAVGWKMLLPLALANLAVTAVLLVVTDLYGLAGLMQNLVLFVGQVALLAIAIPVLPRLTRATATSVPRPALEVAAS